MLTNFWFQLFVGVILGGLLLGDLAMAVCDPRIRLDKTKGGSR